MMKNQCKKGDVVMVEKINPEIATSDEQKRLILRFNDVVDDFTTTSEGTDFWGVYAIMIASFLFGVYTLF